MAIVASEDIIIVFNEKGVQVSTVASRVSWTPPIIADNFPEPDDSYMYEGSLITLPGRSKIQE